MLISVLNQPESIIEAFEEKTAVIGVVGLGYVGLPLAVEKAKAGFNVVGFDVVKERVDSLNRGINHIADVEDRDLDDMITEGRFVATTDFSLMSEVDAAIICVPTPLDKYMQPDISYVKSASEQIAKYIGEGALVVLESTTYPGTTQEIVLPLLEERGFVAGETIYVAYSPERVDPGNKTFKTKNTPKVVGGVTPNCTRVAASLYRNVLEGEVFEVSSPAVAEMEKIFENTFRNINIGLANEMAILCEKMGIDVWEVIDAAKTKPYGFMAFYPGPGLGGHCIPIDPFYLTWKAREYNYHTRLIEVAGEINNSMPDYVVNRIATILNEEGKPVRDAKVLILGVAYKKDIEDMRESPVLPIIEKLLDSGARVTVADPHVKEFNVKQGTIYSENIHPQIMDAFDLVILATDHSSFDYEAIGKHANAIFDTRNAFGGIKVEGKYIKL